MGNTPSKELRTSAHPQHTLCLKSNKQSEQLNTCNLCLEVIHSGESLNRAQGSKTKFSEELQFAYYRCDECDFDICFQCSTKKKQHASNQKAETSAKAKSFVAKAIHSSGRSATIAAVGRYGVPLKSVANQWKDDRDVVLRSVIESAKNLAHASDRLQRDREFILDAVFYNGNALEFALDKWKDEEEIVHQAVARNPASLRFASERFRSDKALVLRVISEDPTYLQYATSKQWQDYKPAVLKAVRLNGMCLQHASKALRGDKECVLAAVKENPAALKFALNGLNQQKECLVAAGIWDASRFESNQQQQQQPIIVLSTRFSLSESSSSAATEFTVLLKRHPYIKRQRKFMVYSPNAFNKNTCDPNWTDLEWPCRGTFDTCQMSNDLKTAEPTDASCWRFSFRHKLEKAAESGCMIQVVEFVDGVGHHLGQGQTIELEMARETGTKVFQVYQPTRKKKSQLVALPFTNKDINDLVRQMKDWYQERERTTMRNTPSKELRTSAHPHILYLKSNKQSLEIHLCSLCHTWIQSSTGESLKSTQGSKTNFSNELQFVYYRCGSCDFDICFHCSTKAAIRQKRVSREKK